MVGHREVPGRPELLGHTRDFLEYFGLKAIEELPPLAALKSLEELDSSLHCGTGRDRCKRGRDDEAPEPPAPEQPE